MSSLWGKDEGPIIQQAQFISYLDILYTLTRHVSPTITHLTCLIWNTLIKHDQISKDSRFLEYIPKLIETIGPKVIKV